MLLAILSTLLVCALALVVIGALSTKVCARLGLHPKSVLRWFGVTRGSGQLSGARNG